MVQHAIYQNSGTHKSFQKKLIIYLLTRNYSSCSKMFKVRMIEIIKATFLYLVILSPVAISAWCFGKMTVDVVEREMPIRNAQVGIQVRRLLSAANRPGVDPSWDVMGSFLKLSNFDFLKAPYRCKIITCVFSFEYIYICRWNWEIPQCSLSKRCSYLPQCRSE